MLKRPIKDNSVRVSFSPLVQLLHVQPEKHGTGGILIKNELKHNKVSDELKKMTFLIHIMSFLFLCHTFV